MGSCKSENVEWVERMTKATFNEFQGKVIDILSSIGGAHNCPINWDRFASEMYPDSCRAVLHTDLSTYDFDHLTRLVVLCHDQAIRLQIAPCMRCLELLFHKRTRDGRFSERHPTIEEAIERIRGGK